MATTPTHAQALFTVPFSHNTDFTELANHCERFAHTLLESDDPDLFNWLMNHGEPADTELQRMVQLIQTRNRERGPVAI